MSNSYQELVNFIENFDFNKPDWSSLPQNFPNCDLEGLDSQQIGKFNSTVTFWEISHSPKITLKSCVRRDQKGCQAQQAKIKRKFKTYSVLFLCLFVFFFVWFRVSFALQQEEPVTIAVYPPIFELELEKGESYQDQILLRNRSGFSVPIQAEIFGFTATDEIGGIAFQEEDGSKDWFKIEKPNFILEPKESERVKFSINVPKDVTRGGYYVTALFKSKLPPHYFEEEATKVMPQVGVLFLISVGKKGEADFEIIEANVSERVRIRFLETLATRNRHETEHETDTKQKIIIANSVHIPFVFRVKNNDVYHVKPSGTLQIFGSGDRIVGEFEVKETTILPGKIRKLEVNFEPALFEKLDRYLPNFLANFISENLFFGKHKVLLKLHGSAEVEKEMELLIFPWKGIAILLLLVFLILFIIIKSTKQTSKENKFPTGQVRNKTLKSRLRRTTGQARNRHKKIIEKKKVLIDGIKK